MLYKVKLYLKERPGGHIVKCRSLKIKKI